MDEEVLLIYLLLLSVLFSKTAKTKDGLCGDLHQLKRYLKLKATSTWYNYQSIKSSRWDQGLNNCLTI